MTFTATELLRKANLPESLGELLITSNPTKNLPYHGTFHMVEVAYYAQKLSKILGLSPKATTHLTVASLIHDYNHTGDSSQPDSSNIANAVSFLKTNTETLENHGLDVKQLILLVKSTEHPLKKKPMNLTAAVIADADLLFWVDPETTGQQMLERMKQLQVETGNPVTVETTHAFINANRFWTTPAWNFQRQSIWKSTIPEVQQFLQNG